MAWDPIWEEVFKQQPWGKYPSEDLIRFIARNFYGAQDRTAVRMLEVGCGPGANLWYMAREGFSVYGIDGSETAIAHARARLDRECPGWSGTLAVGAIEALPFADCFFDAVVDNEAVYANPYDHSKNIYREIRRVLKPNGKLFSRTFAAGSWGEGTGTPAGRSSWVANEGPLREKGHSRFTPYGDIADLLEGFVITEVELIMRTMENRRREIKEWVIIAEKP